MIRPIGKRILVKPKENVKTLPSGIVLTHNSQAKPHMGVIVALGDGITTLYEGEMVCFRQDVGVDLILAKESYIIIDFDDVLAVLTDEEEGET